MISPVCPVIVKAVQGRGWKDLSKRDRTLIVATTRSRCDIVIIALTTITEFSL